MQNLILRIYDYLSGHKWLAAGILALISGLCVLSASRLSFKEDISDFLPGESRIRGQEKMAVLFEGGTLDTRLDAMYAFEDAWRDTGSGVELYASADEGEALELMEYISANWPYFLMDADYARMDSLLAVPGYIDRELEACKTTLLSPNPIAAKYTRADPLHLFVPVMERLREASPDHALVDGCLFTPGGETGIILFDSPYGGSETANNAKLIDQLNAVKARVQEQYPELDIYSTGGPEVAVENASTIKKDSMLALAIAAILICIVLWLSYKRFQDVLWILISIAFGAVFALGAIALLKPSISIIILGIGCTVIGIAVNYPLHYVDHLKYEPDKREALAQQVSPLLTGNITTVGAFLGLLLMKAPALRDFGFIGAMMLLGTIVFVLVFLPVFVPAAKGPRNAIRLDPDRFIKPSERARRYIFLAFIALTVFFAFQGRKVGFDSNLHNINCITPEQEKGFRVLESLGQEGEIWQEGSVENWNAFTARHPSLGQDLVQAGISHGFTADAFLPFTESLEKEWEPLPPQESIGQSLVEALNGDFDKIGLICSLIVFIFLLISFRSLEIAIIAFLPLAVSWVWIQGIMGIAGLSFNIVNIILATFIFGMGDDYTIFITEGLIYERESGRKILHSFRNAVILSALIMFIGIGVLAFAKHPAMRSLGIVTVIGMITVVIMACYLPPILYRWLTSKNGKPRRKPVTIWGLVKTGWILFLFGTVLAGMTVWAYLYFLVGKDSEEKRLRFHKAIQKVASLAIHTIPGAKYTLSNPYGEDFSTPAVIVCNHQSHLDVLAIMALTPKVVFTTNQWVWNFPLYSYILRKAEFYPAANGHFGNAAHVEDLLRRGYSIMIFPEGTRSLDGKVLRFHRGSFLTAREYGVDILPLCIHGFSNVLPKHDFILRSGALSLEVGKRIQVPEDAEIRAFTRQMRHMYQSWCKDDDTETNSKQ